MKNLIRSYPQTLEYKKRIYKPSTSEFYRLNITAGVVVLAGLLLALNYALH
jgi:hypothetical protein